MGRAVITANIGAGLYRARPVYNDAAVSRELALLRQANLSYSKTIAAAYRAQELLDREAVEAGAALNAVVAQWKAALIDKATLIPPLPPPTETDPDTGEAWVDPDRAQDAPLFDAINAARAAAGVPPLTRKPQLDTAARKYLKYQGYTNRIGSIDETGLKPENRIAVEGYAASAADELLSYGDMTPDAVVAGWLKNPEMRAKLLDPAFTECGVSYHHSPQHFAGQLWGLELATPGPTPEPVTLQQPDPVTGQSEAVNGTLNKIEVPTVDDFSPKQLGEAAQKYGIAIGKVRLAEREIARLRAEKLARDKRIAVLEGIEASHQPMDVWCYRLDDQIAVGAEVDTVEVPGFWKEAGTVRDVTLYKWLDGTDSRKRVVSMTERSWNIAPTGGYGETTGKLASSEGISDAAVFVNAALEPGHIKWRPRWRYGMLTSMSASGAATVALNTENSRGFHGEAPLTINAQAGVNCGCRYPDCDAEAFRYNNQMIPDLEVLVGFSGADRSTATVLGFRREPLPCPSGRVSWVPAGF